MKAERSSFDGPRSTSKLGKLKPLRVITLSLIFIQGFSLITVINNIAQIHFPSCKLAATMTKEQTPPPPTMQIRRNRITIRGALWVELKIHTGLTVYLLTHTFQAQTCNQPREVNHPHTILSRPNSTPTSKTHKPWGKRPPSQNDKQKSQVVSTCGKDSQQTTLAFRPRPMWLLLRSKLCSLTFAFLFSQTQETHSAETNSVPRRVSFTSKLLQLQDADMQCFYKSI